MSPIIELRATFVDMVIPHQLCNRCTQPGTTGDRERHNQNYAGDGASKAWKTMQKTGLRSFFALSQALAF